VGGAPEWISRCDYGGGCAGTINVNGGTLTDSAHVRQFPADSTVVGNHDDGGIYRFAGGAPEWISRYDYGGGCAGAKELDAGTFSSLGTQTASLPHMRSLPSDGTLVSNADDGGIYRIAGGAPLWISRCDYGGGCPSVVALDSGTFTHQGTATAAQPHLRVIPPDGTLVHNQDDGGTYRFAGGAPELISRCNYGGGCPSVVPVDGGTFSHLATATPAQPHMRTMPPDGTLVHDEDDNGIYRFAGGAPEWISRCDYGGGCAGVVPLDGVSFQRLGTATPRRPDRESASRRPARSACAAVTLAPTSAPPPPVITPPPPVITPPAPAPPVVAPPKPRRAFDPRFNWSYIKSRGRTTFTSLSIARLPAGSRVTVKCTGGGCPFGSRRVRPRHGRVQLRALLRRSALAPGAVLRLTATSASGQRKIVTLTLRGGLAGPRRSTRCGAAGARRLRSC
jgi:hypothetical protein